MTTLARGFLGAGDVFFNVEDPVTNLDQGWVYAGNAKKFSIKVSADIKDMTSKGRADYGNVVASVAIPKPAELSIDFAEVNRDNIHLAFMGTKSAINTSSGSVTGEAVTLRAGVGTSLARTNISATGLALKNGVTSYVVDTDYTINYRLGIITPIAGSSLATAIAAATDGALSCTIDYGYAATTGTQVDGAQIPQIRCKLRMDGKNFADGMPVQVEVFEALLTTNGEFDFLASDWNSISMTGRMQVPVGKSAPFEVRLFDSV
jgi:hypothetical protein